MDKTPAHTHPPRILVIRRDNIGDLVCTTPLFSLLRQHFPQAWIGAWVNSYNAPVLDNNPDIDARFVYTKAKHRGPDESLLGIYWRRLGLLRQLRAMRLDTVIIATTTPQPRLVRMARWLRPKQIIGFGPCGADVEFPLDTGERHEVEDVLRAAAALGIDLAGLNENTSLCTVLATKQDLPEQNLIAIHISARKPSQRWSADNFVALMRRLHQQSPQLSFRLLWAPGASDDPMHPGDDEKAAQIMAALGDQFPVQACPTHTLPKLIEALAGCGRILCADGGAMHLAAGLGLPIVCLFGNSGSQRWRPWGVPYRLLQKPSLVVEDISVDEVLAAFNALSADIQATDAAVPA